MCRSSLHDAVAGGLKRSYQQPGAAPEHRALSAPRVIHARLPGPRCGRDGIAPPPTPPEATLSGVDAPWLEAQRYPADAIFDCGGHAVQHHHRPRVIADQIAGVWALCLYRARNHLGHRGRVAHDALHPLRRLLETTVRAAVARPLAALQRIL